MAKKIKYIINNCMHAYYIKDEKEKEQQENV
jgi:hypothetical protein